MQESPIHIEGCPGVVFHAAAVVARWRLPPGLEADDCVQELCVRWLVAPPRLLEPDPVVVQRWLGGVLRNLVREWARRRDRLREGHEINEESPDRWRASVRDAVEDEPICRQRLRAWLVQRLAPLESDIFLAHRWDGESFLVACASHGVRAECTVAALRRKFSRFLSNEAVKRAYLLWLRDGDVPRA